METRGPGHRDACSGTWRRGDASCGTQGRDTREVKSNADAVENEIEYKIISLYALTK